MGGQRGLGSTSLSIPVYFVNQCVLMPLDLQLTQRSFDKLNRQLSKLTANPTPESVHQFRTYARRVEVLLGEMAGQLSGNDKKLVKLLARARKKAGRVRDLDVQLGLLRTLRSPQAPAQKSQLQRVLGEERARREKKLGKSFTRELVKDMGKRLRRTERDFSAARGKEPVAVALGLLTQVRYDGAMSEDVLHRYRTAGKRARYVAELAGDGPEAKRLAGQLKDMQDVIGDWHDWLQLSQRATELFGDAQESPLVAELRNVTRAKFREAVGILAATRAALGAKPATMEKKRERRMENPAA
jgi:CHAD domain-containing protein